MTVIALVVLAGVCIWKPQFALLLKRTAVSIVLALVALIKLCASALNRH